jgi:Domain of unknown function (DUF4386)
VAVAQTRAITVSPNHSRGGPRIRTIVRAVPELSVPAPSASHQTRAGTGTSTVTSPKRLVRIAGVLYLLVGITVGGFAEGFVEPKVYVAGDAAATVANVLANAALVSLGVVADLLDQTFFVFLALALYALLRHLHQSAARAMLVLVAVGIASLNTVSLFEGLRVATGAISLADLGTAGSSALVLLLLDTQRYGILVAQILFGLRAGAPTVSRLHVRDVPRVARRCAHRGASATSWTCSRHSWSLTLAK